MPPLMSSPAPTSMPPLMQPPASNLDLLGGLSLAPAHPSQDLFSGMGSGMPVMQSSLGPPSLPPASASPAPSSIAVPDTWKELGSLNISLNNFSLTADKKAPARVPMNMLSAQAQK